MTGPCLQLSALVESWPLLALGGLVLAASGWRDHRLEAEIDERSARLRWPAGQCELTLLDLQTGTLHPASNGDWPCLRLSGSGFTWQIHWPIEEHLRELAELLGEHYRAARRAARSAREEGGRSQEAWNQGAAEPEIVREPEPVRQERRRDSQPVTLVRSGRWGWAEDWFED